MTATPAEIIKFAAYTHGTTPEQMKSPSNDLVNRKARFLAAWAMRHYLKMTYKDISDLLGRRGRWSARFLSGGNSYPKFRRHRSEVIRFVRSLNLGLAESRRAIPLQRDQTFLR